MPPPNPHTEDSQPNEIRLGRGVVPMIRHTGPSRGISRGRGRSLHPTGPRPDQAHWRSSFSNRSGPPPTAPRSHRGSFKRPLEFLPRSHQPFKRPRTDFAPQDPPFPAGSSSSKKNKSLENRIDILVELPPHCRRGVTGSHKARQEWLNNEITRVQTERRVLIRGHVLLERAVRLKCLEEQPVYAPDRNDTLIAEGAGANESVIGDVNTNTEERAPPLYDANTALQSQTIDDNFIHGIPPEDRGDPEETIHRAQLCGKGLSNSQPMSTVGSTGEIARFIVPRRPSPYSISLRKGQNFGKSSTEIPRPSNSVIDLTVSLPVDNINPQSSIATGTSRSTKQTRSHTTESYRPATYRHIFRSGTLVVAPCHLPSLSDQPEAVPVVLASPSGSTPLTRNSEPQKKSPFRHGSTSSESDDPLACIIVPRPRSSPKRRSIDWLERGSSAKESTPSSVSSRNRPQSVAESSTAITVRQISESSSFRGAPVIQGNVVRITGHRHGKNRRILVPSGHDRIFNVSSYGFINQIDISPLRARDITRTVGSPSQEHVEDACLLNGPNHLVVVLGHARDDKQISLVAIKNQNSLDISSLDHPSGTKKGGISTVATMMQPLMFASGSHDHTVNLWNVREDFSSATAQPLAIRHTSMVQSLLPIRDTSRKLVSTGADCNVHLWDLSSERVVNTMRTSNSVYHAHATSSPFCTLLEVAHREFQFEVRDHRLVPEKMVQRFGYNTEHLHGRFIKGDSLANSFACGDRDGCVRCWDMRNVSGAPTAISCFPGQKVVHVTFMGSSLIASSDDKQFAMINYL